MEVVWNLVGCAPPDVPEVDALLRERLELLRMFSPDDVGQVEAVDKLVGPALDLALLDHVEELDLQAVDT